MPDVGIDAVADGDTGNGCARLQAFLNDLGFEWFRIRASLAHGNPGDKGYRVRLKYADTIALNAGVRKVTWLDAYDSRTWCANDAALYIAEVVRCFGIYQAVQCKGLYPYNFALLATR